MYETLKLDVDGAVALVTLNNPSQMNALSHQMLAELSKLLDELENDNSIGVTVFWGGERLFGAGANIKEVSQIEKSYDAFVWSRGIQKVFNRIENSSKATMAAIGGIALGGCLELALACDLRIASRSAKVGLPEINLGVLPGAGGTQRLPRLIGASKAKEMLLIGEPVPAEEAYRLGLVNRVVEDGSLLEESMKMAKQIAAKAPLARAMIKSAVNVGIGLDIEKGLEHEAKCFAILFNTDDLREGTKAFLEKRAADFRGR
ncbi:MAG TPA: enoyl-CoA hydratase/isomerase family protein [Syntrophothermus lipocalidus]|uniref:short-chain-enoyl-CoA hydratase n=1 Tax=Syntrophothermus lipocalidus (strain DSM 12680 / TGB-C1) TaxID=643648 RepID=D7CKN4_SYNLT|nr:enoyl-CoA hydratase-related protein [Syntrophothermus lipocalidus]ADI01269.1 Enoyl-CoA hydratase/isomerase [Syntrophothermus lipocalidus DSM 12680]HHV76370.1 enoyl-CoA hydratase/isomerase family protein [Syntrophothermus lipocalidus]